MNKATINDILDRGRDVLTLDPTQTVAEAAAVMRDHKIGCLVVLGETGQILGILSERDIVTRVVADGRCPSSTSVNEVMTHNVMVCTPRTPLDKAQSVMNEYRMRHLPVVEDGVLAGMISGRDLLAKRLHVATAALERHSDALHEIERQFPGISHFETDQDGRILV